MQGAQLMNLHTGLKGAAMVKRSDNSAANLCLLYGFAIGFVAGYILKTLWG